VLVPPPAGAPSAGVVLSPGEAVPALPVLAGAVEGDAGAAAPPMPFALAACASPAHAHALSSSEVHSAASERR
jgi:hypothetical protein